MEVQSTTDFESLVRITGNREIKPGHVKNLAEAIRKDPLSIQYNPILVNEKKEIIDGQHRKYAIASLWDEMKLPAYYIQQDGLTLDNVIKLNSGTKAWTPMDYADLFIERGNNNYRIYKQFKEDFGLNHDVLVKFLGLDDSVSLEAFKQGKLIVPDEKKSRQLCEDLIDFIPIYKRWQYRGFAFGFYRLWKDDQYDHSRMIHKASVYKDRIVDKSRPEEYATILQEIYNTKVAEKNRVWFNPKNR